jgi:23S rRNA (uracil1939-C5)-methyltransferase
VTLVGRDYIEEEIAGRRYRLSANSFFQVNTEQAGHLVRLVQEALAPEGPEILLDMYCGVGTFGLSLADRVQRVIGIEENAYAIEDAEANAQSLGNVSFYAGRVEDILPNLQSAVELAVVDPPRSGIEAGALQALIGLAPRRIAYVSCDPASLARDLKNLGAAGYAVRSVQPVDMFPQTYHIESVTLLER